MAGTVATKLAWDKRILEPVFREIYDMGGKKRAKKDFIPLMYRIVKSDKDRESYEGVSAQTLMTPWDASNNQVHYQSIQELWPVVIRNVKYSDGRMVERDLVDDNKLGELIRRIESLAGSVFRTQQLQAVEWMNNAFQTTGADFQGVLGTYSGPDGLPLCATNHPLVPGGTDLQSNKGVKPLTIDSWDETAVAMQSWVDDKGVPIGAIPDTLIVHPYNARAAFKIAGLPDKDYPAWEPGSDHFDANMYQGHIKVIVNPYIPAAKRMNWFAVDSDRMMDLNIWQDRRKPSENTEFVFDTEVTKFSVIGRWAKGFLNPFFVYGHEVPTS